MHFRCFLFCTLYVVIFALLQIIPSLSRGRAGMRLPRDRAPQLFKNLRPLPKLRRCYSSHRSVLFDLSAAFDTMLLQRLQTSFGLSDVVLS